MKTALLWSALAVNLFAAQPILVRITPDTLAKLQAKDPMIRLVQPEAGTPAPKEEPVPSLIGSSTLLHDGDCWTLVPEGAVVHLPSSLKSRVVARPVGTLLPWAAFAERNKSWLGTVEVSFEQAAGNEELPARFRNTWNKQEKLIVATHRMGPISVRVAAANTQTASK